jgi:hypothetical protein
MQKKIQATFTHRVWDIPLFLQHMAGGFKITRKTGLRQSRWSELLHPAFGIADHHGGAAASTDHPTNNNS